MIRPLINAAAFQVGWFACVIGAANGMPWAGPLVVLAAIVVHLRMALRPGPEIRLMVSAVLIGLFADSLLIFTGLVSYPGGTAIAGLAPYWILAMWALFATTLNVSMKWLRNRGVLATLAGAAGGPLSYLAGRKIGAIEFPDPVYTLTALAVIWAVAMPLLMWLASRMDGMSEVNRVSFIHDDWRVSNHA